MLMPNKNSRMYKICAIAFKEAVKCHLQEMYKSGFDSGAI